MQIVFRGVRCYDGAKIHFVGIVIAEGVGSFEARANLPFCLGLLHDWKLLGKQGIVVLVFGPKTFKGLLVVEIGNEVRMECRLRKGIIGDDQL